MMGEKGGYFLLIFCEESRGRLLGLRMGLEMRHSIGGF